MTWLSQLFGFFKAFQLWIVIAPWEAALRVRAGKNPKVLRAGVNFRIPFLDRIFVQSVRLRTISDSGQTMTTLDGKTCTIAVAVSYSITDIYKLYMNVNNPESTLLHQLQGKIAAIVAGTNSTALTTGLIETEAVSAFDAAIGWGIGDLTLMVTTFAYAKTIKLLNYEYRSLSKANELEN